MSPAYWLILKTQSSYFERAFETDFNEKEICEFRFKEESAYTLWKVFKFIYAGDYSDKPAEELIAKNEQGIKTIERPGFGDIILDELELLKYPRVWAWADRLARK